MISTQEATAVSTAWGISTSTLGTVLCVLALNIFAVSIGLLVQTFALAQTASTVGGRDCDI